MSSIIPSVFSAVLPSVRPSEGVSPIPYEPEALKYFSNNGITDATAKNQLNSLIKQLKTAGLWSKLLYGFPLRSAHMSQSGTTTYGLKGDAGTLVNGIERDANGVKSTALLTHSINFTTAELNGTSTNGYYMYAAFYPSITGYVSGVDPFISLGIGTTYAMQLAKRSNMTNSFRTLATSINTASGSHSNANWHSSEGIVTSGTATLYVDRTSQGSASFGNFGGTTIQGKIAVSPSSGTGFYLQPFAAIFSNFTESDRATLKTILDATIYTGLTIP